MDDFFAKKDAKKKSKGKKIYTEAKVSKPADNEAQAVVAKATETVEVAKPPAASTSTNTNTNTNTEPAPAGASEPKKKEVIEDGWVQDTGKEIDLSGLKIAEYVAPAKDKEKDDAETEEATWAKKQIEAGIPDMQVDIGSDGKTEQQIAEEDQKAVWKPSWRSRHPETTSGRTNQGKPPTLNSQSFPSLQQTTSQPAPGGERAVGLKSFTEVRNDRRGYGGSSEGGYRGGYQSSAPSARSYGGYGGSSREPERGSQNRFESLGRR